MDLRERKEEVAHAREKQLKLVKGLEKLEVS